MGKDLTKINTTFEFCDGGSCRKAKSELAVREARAYLRNEQLWDTTHSIRTRCNGRCEDAPTWIVQPGNYWYKNVTPEKAEEIVHSHTQNGTPLPEYLLFQKGDEAVRSDNEKTIAPIVFKEKNDVDFGQALVARASASDQYLYPVFKKLFTTFFPFTIDHKHQLIHIENHHKVSYADAFDVDIIGTNLELKLAIGPITKAIEKEVDADVLERKVGVAEVIWTKENSTFVGAIRLKNRKGKHLITFLIPKDNTALWEYILSVYLGMDIANPRIVLN
ncbi:(2Fe-2S) ferredoxin domain-containing protein [Aquimarina rhabdastrellae]